MSGERHDAEPNVAQPGDVGDVLQLGGHDLRIGDATAQDGFRQKEVELRGLVIEQSLPLEASGYRLGDRASAGPPRQR